MSKAKSTRQIILEMLKKNDALTANEMAAQLQITDIAVRRHLQSLEKDQLVQTKLVRQAMGRPTYAYTLTESSELMFPKKYADITLDFLQDVQELQGEAMIDSLFERREKRLREKYGQAMQGQELEMRVGELAQLQDDRGYMAEWQQDAATGRYVLTEHNCPIHAVAHQFHQACSSELALFRNVLGADVQQVECKAKGGHRCVYVVSPKAE
ncbi:helix-turn-helix transcriptional regulator [Paenibacillus koleovorans]|uniref:helix-turn-helix transcriptional regulator n=1 Tax=Paenibacillus koleovorans TaxID=121608 RepID=UPI000FDC1888|nr:metalloregulator ArsR/SmtB family transcription factor [Paenibacillus koleovorans]